MRPSREIGVLDRRMYCVSDKTVQPVGEPKALGSLKHQDYILSAKALEEFVASKDGSIVDEAVKAGTVKALIESALGSIEERIEDIRYLGSLGVRFAPLVAVSERVTSSQAARIWGTNVSNVLNQLSKPETRDAWKAQCEKKDRLTRWFIPAETVNGINLTLKTSIPLMDLHAIASKMGVRMKEETFKRFFTDPRQMGAEGLRLLEGRGGDSLLVQTIFGRWKDYTDVTSAAAAMRHVRGKKRVLDQGLRTQDAAKQLGMSESQVRKLIRSGEIQGTKIRGQTVGGARYRVTEEGLMDAVRTQEAEQVDLVKAIKEIKAEEKERRTVVKYSPSVNPAIRGRANRVFLKYGGVEDVPEGDRAKLGRMGVTIRPETDKELRERLVLQRLFEMFGSISDIEMKVPKATLAQIGFAIEGNAGSLRIRPVERSP